MEGLHVFAPDSVGLLVGLGAIGVLAMLVAVRRGFLLLRLVAGLTALLTVFVAGAAAVNVYFGYFMTWADVSAGLGNGPAAAAVVGGSGSGLSQASIQNVIDHLPVSKDGNLLTVPLYGHLSHINRKGLVWLPPQYREPAYAHIRFPVMELIPGTPGQPADWVESLHVTTMLASLVASRHIGPMVVVLAPSNPPIGKGHGQECTNKPRGFQDSTFVGTDIPADIAADFPRVYKPGPRWAIAGYSSGGYCATEMALKHPGTYGAVADLDGYLSPLEDGGLYFSMFYGNTAALQADDISAELALDHRRLPAFYLAAGTGNREDIDDLVTLRTLLRGRANVTTVTNGGGHTFPVWRAELPAVFVWIWHQIGHPVTHPATHRAHRPVHRTDLRTQVPARR